MSSEVERSVAPSMVIRLSSHSTISRPRPRWPARPAASWLIALHQAAVAGDHPGAVIDQIVAELGVEVPLGDRHADRHREPLPERPGGRLDAVEQEILGMAGAGAAELAEAADVVDRRPRVAGQVKQRVDQHRAVAGRKHEAVAVGPVRVGRDRASDIRSTARSRRRPCPSACRDGRYWRPRPRPSTRARMALASVRVGTAMGSLGAGSGDGRARARCGSFIGGGGSRQPWRLAARDSHAMPSLMGGSTGP